MKLEEKLKNISFLSGNMIKIFAIFAMLFDHFCKIVLLWIDHNVWSARYDRGEISWERFQELDNFLRFDLFSVGTIAFPLFCFLIAEGFYYTRNKERYCLLMGAFALISEIPFDIGFFYNLSILEGTYPLYWDYQNVFFTLFLGSITLLCMEKLTIEQKRKKLVVTACLIMAIAAVAELIKSDYGSQGVLFIVGFYVLRKHRIYQVICLFVIFTLTTGNEPTIFFDASSLIILFYNGQRGKVWNKYFFYWFYPVHILVLTFIRSALESFL